MTLLVGLLLASAAASARASRMQHDQGQDEGGSEAATTFVEAAAGNARRGGKGSSTDRYCCCKRAACGGDDVGDDGVPGVYSPDHGLCCEKKDYSSCSMGEILPTYFFTVAAPNTQFCVERQDVGLNMPVPVLRAEEIEDSNPGTLAHTVTNYCDLSQHQLRSGPVAQEAEEQVRDQEPVEAKMRRLEIIDELVGELSKNSLDVMAKELFSIYVCVRWAPSPDFMAMAKDEVETKQFGQGEVDEVVDPMKLFAERRFIPMRCSRNVNVYDVDPRVNNQTHFMEFEKMLQALAGWFRGEDGGVVQQRLEGIQKKKLDQLEAWAQAFDLKKLKSVVAGCDGPAKRVGVNMGDAQAQEILGDCGAARYWLKKLEDWHSALPFTSFLAPSEEAAAHAPKEKQHVLVCFGKRVASQLHRRTSGGHLMTDQSAVGCHGFHALKEAGDMLLKTVHLWRPPTCQLQTLEVELKVKLMEVIADMNSRLFDALPAMLLDEATSGMDTDSNALKAKGAISTFGHRISSRVQQWFAKKNEYKSLGLLLGNTVAKWSVCPLRKFDSDEEGEALDTVLGTEDDLARYYAELAYSKFTGKASARPGETCSAPPDSPVAKIVPRCQECDLGDMRENMPEPYANEEFICPIRPLLQPSTQLRVFEQAHHEKGLCIMHMTLPQWSKKEWIYRGRSPQKKQYNVTENPPTRDYEAIKIVSWRSAPDSEFAIWRDFVSYGRRCTEEEAAQTPRWCEPPKVLNPKDHVAITALKEAGKVALAAGKGAVSGVAHAAEAAGYIEQQAPTNKAYKERSMAWAYGVWKSSEAGIKGAYQVMLGRASKRYNQLQERLFAEVEAGELLHSASFQKEIKSIGDSKGYRKFNRYSITCPCPGFNPKREFNLKYTWGENALRLAAKAIHEVRKSLLMGAPAFQVELQAAATLHMRSNEDARTQMSASIRTGPLGQAPSKWKQFTEPLLNALVGVQHTRLGSSLTSHNLFGLRATFVCGTRKAMHDLALSLDPKQLPQGVEPFGKCVSEGIESNKVLKQASPTQLFFPDEIVVRVTFEPVSKACHHEHFTKDDHMPRMKPAVHPTAPPEKYFYERENDLYQAFKNAGQDCAQPTAESKKQLASSLQWRLAQKDYRGLLVADKVPKDTLREVLLDPADVLSELGSV